VQLFRTLGLGLAVGTLLCGLVRFDDPGRWVDLLAALYLGWLLGWAMGPIAARGAGQGLRPEWFALLPIPPLRLATGLLGRTMRRPTGRAPRARRVARGGTARRGTAAATPTAWRLLPASPTGAVVGRELYAWRRDSARTLLLLMALLVSGLNLAVPALAFSAPALLPWVGLGAALIVSTGAANVYGEDGTAFWLTRMVPGVERADVRGRQVAWLLVVGPAMVVLTVALIALTGQGWAWPFVLATLAAVLGPRRA
jgi:ABC-2 type transport system permease protein